MSFVCLLEGLITYWKKDLELLCMLCNLCFVSVKKVEKWVSWLLVSVDMAPSEIFMEDNPLVWHSKKIWFPGHDNLRSHATSTLPPPPFATTNIQIQACRHIQNTTSIHAHNHAHLLARSAAERRDAI